MLTVAIIEHWHGIMSYIYSSLDEQVALLSTYHYLIDNNVIQEGSVNAERITALENAVMDFNVDV